MPGIALQALVLLSRSEMTAETLRHHCVDFRQSHRVLLCATEPDGLHAALLVSTGTNWIAAMLSKGSVSVIAPGSDHTAELGLTGVTSLRTLAQGSILEVNESLIPLQICCYV